MRSKVIKNSEEYDEVCERVYELMHSSDAPIEPDSKEGEELELLSLLVEQYERENYKIEAPDPIEAIIFRMEQMGLKQKDVAPLFGGKTRVSEVLNRKRPLTLKMITLLNSYLGIPFESLIVEDRKMTLDKNKKDTLLRNPSIREYLKKTKNKRAMI